MIVTDQGTEFTNEVVRRLADRLGIDHIFSSAYHHQTVGMSERFNRFLNDTLNAYVKSDEHEWDKFVPTILFAYMSSVHPATGDSPFYLVFGYDPRNPNKMRRKPRKKRKGR